jgi:Zn-dependent peptidase ImmA (M78 family)/transcriptional regulator with XRE-family HTH domain
MRLLRCTSVMAMEARAEALNRGHRVVDLRHLLILTQKELSGLSGIAQSNLSAIERGDAALTASSIQRICSATATPMSFFGCATPDYGGEAINFRKGSRVSAKGRDFIVQAFKEIERISLVLDEASVRLRRVQLPLAEESDVVGEHDIDLVADDVREAFGLGPHDPIRNVTRMMERAGIAVAPLTAPFENESLLDGHCGMSRWASGSPRAAVAFVNGMPGDRLRFTIAHEFGHVILHSRRTVDDVKQREREANYFAGALLLPRTFAEQAVSESLTLQGYMRIKARFGIAIQAIIMRGRNLGLISRDRQRSLMIQISSRGWRRNEPVVVGSESPMLLHRELVATYGTNPYFDASSTLGVSPILLQDWIPPRGLETAQRSALVVELQHRRR